MTTNDVRNLTWIPVTDWEELPATHYDRYDANRQYYWTQKSDVLNFTKNIFLDVSRKLNIPFIELEPILKAENRAFYDSLDNLFYGFRVFQPTNTRLLKVLHMLKIPNSEKNPVNHLLAEFSALSESEKLEVLQKLGKVSVTVEFNK